MGERVYLDHLRKVLESGQRRADRTGTGTLSLFGEQTRFDISESVPLLTTKHVPWKACVRELLWFLRGETDATSLRTEGVRIWDANSSRAFLDARGLRRLPEGDIGAGYGFQWRHFGAEYISCKDNYAGLGFDQIAYVERELKADPFSRRIFMSAWNPAALRDMALPPCHVSAQFYVGEGGWLSCHMYQRSNDEFLGKPWNIFSYTALTYLLAKRCDLKPKELIISCGDSHVYLDHVEQVELQLSREPFPAPTLHVGDSVVGKRWADITVDDFDVRGYQHHPAIKARLSV